MPLRLLVVASETPDQQAARRRRSGLASHETYAETLRDMDPDCIVEHHSCVEGSDAISEARLGRFDGAIFAGSPIQMHEDRPEVRSAAGFMARVFGAGLPSFGSCAGLQIAAVAAGGTVKPRDAEMEAGFARCVVASDAGRAHPMLQGRPGAWDAPTMHSAMVDRMPAGGTVLASTAEVPIEAAEIRSGRGVFWGVQYHPELALREIAEALRGQSDALVDQGLARSPEVIDSYSRHLEALDADPARRDLAWQLGLDAEVIDKQRRRREIRNFLRHLKGAASPR
ncbi:glutamine amidotransferase-related protein [Pseudoroseicyclus aestuarii]|uniref:GMP synthase (Glutamine-hydrolysing) n=1 Tax=Pseudoroseicyclus aestuarii TaxID=1795041 RepID=A0A318SVV4_9RHOB|nr:gamma-glutamyl-gamma-aminobutyrate hydrolase family protein [Pseudoroseicyclus aestuarii]PYE85733.1 GMP synthase (glutamine-hydrolysing) [Pseudoroseicyclus aestuarii]